MKLLLVSIQLQHSWQGNSGNTTQREKHHGLHTIFAVTLPAENYTLVQQAINGHTHQDIESAVKPCSKSSRTRCQHDNTITYIVYFKLGIRSFGSLQLVNSQFMKVLFTNLVQFQFNYYNMFALSKRSFSFSFGKLKQHW